MDRYERILTLHRILKSSRYPVPFDRLKDELRCSRATLYRDIAFLRDGSLPMSARSQRIVREILVRDQGEGWALHAKTGWADAPEPDIGWFVGWVERGGKAYVYALNADLARDGDAPKREQVARRLLAGEGLLPKS